MNVQAVIEVDVKNTARLKQIVSMYGWPTKALVGEDGAAAAWLIAQHADRDPVFQLKVLKMIGPLVQVGEVSRNYFAYLYDRTHRPQMYGTQGSCSANGTWIPREIKDPEGVDARRSEAGISPPKLADYIALVSSRSCPK